MGTGKRKKPLYSFWIFLLILSLYTGYSLGKLDFDVVTIDNFLMKVQYALLHPFPLQTTEYTKNCIMLAVLLWLIAFLSYLSKLKNYMPGKEYGTAQYANPSKINKKLSDTKPEKNKIFSMASRMSIDTRKTRLNNNALYIGGAGTGKTMFAVTPNTLQCLSTYIFTDSKGELLRDNAYYLKSKGYTIKVLNLINMLQSDGYNPFCYIRSETDIIKLITNLIANTTPKKAMKGDPFWEKSEAMYLQALFLYVWLEYPKQNKKPNFRGVMELINMAEVPEDEGEQSELDKLIYALDNKHPALIAYNKVRRGAADTIRSIIISANSRLAFLENPEVLDILDDDEMDIPFLGTGVRNDKTKKTALFCVIPDNDKSYNFIVGMLYTQIFQELYYQADFKYSGRLPIPVMFWMDEFANVALPEDFCSLLSTMRSREISCNIIIQNLAQIKTLFKDSWETITGNCDVLVYLGGNEQSTHKYISEMLGKWTIDKRTTGESLGRNGSSSRNYDVLGRELMTPDEVRKIPNEKCLIFIRGQDPIYDLKYKTFETVEFKESRSYGEYVHLTKRNENKEGKNMDGVEYLTKTEVEYYQKEAANNPNISFVEISAEQLSNLKINEIAEINNLSEDDIKNIVNQKEFKNALSQSAKEDNLLKNKCDILEATTHSESKYKKMNLSERLMCGEYSVEQLEEAHTGIKNGLPEKVILLYFYPDYSVEKMKTMRLLTEAAILES